MPISFAPTKSSAHRLACLSLYKNLLKGCTKILPTPADDVSQVSRSSSSSSPASTLQNLVRYRFKRDKKFRNWQQIRDALHFGRETLQLLERAATGSATALEEIARGLSASADLAVRQKGLLQKARDERAQRPTYKKVLELKEHEARRADRKKYLPRPDGVPVVQRPVPYERAVKDEQGNRKLPNYFVVAAVPFLRYGRRQPPLLSQYMHNQLKTYDSLWTKLKERATEARLAEHEDGWEQILWQDHGVAMPDVVGAGAGSSSSDPATKWGHIPRALLHNDRAKIKEIDAKRLAHGSKLWDVYLKEEALAEQEKAQRSGKTTTTATGGERRDATSSSDRVGVPVDNDERSKDEEKPTETATALPNFHPFGTDIGRR